MKKVVLVAALVLLVSAPLTAQLTKHVDCDKGETLTKALSASNSGAAARQLTIEFTGTCTESLLIDRDHVTLRGDDDDATVIGLIDIIGASNVVFRNFTIVGPPDIPLAGNLAGINAQEGSAVNVDGVLVRDVNARCIRIIGASAFITNTTTLRCAGGGYAFRDSKVLLGGDIVANESVFGISFVNSGGFARDANIIVNDNVFGLVVQITSSLEHVDGLLSAHGNLIGVGLFSQGGYAHGTEVDVQNNAGIGLWIDEMSNMTPLIGAPVPDPPFINVSNNGQFGLVLERIGVLQLIPGSLIQNNMGPGLLVDESQFLMDGTTISGNGVDVTMSFGSRGTFGTGNSIATPVQCDSTVLTRGPIGCGAMPLTGPSTHSISSVGAPLEARRIPEGVLEGVMESALTRLPSLSDR